MTDDTGQPDPRPVLAFVVHYLPPFRVHIQRRIAREIPELRLHTLASWSLRENPWPGGAPAEVGLVTFPGAIEEREFNTHRAGAILADWRTGGALIDWVRRHRPACVVLCGYAFASHFRLLRHLRARRIPYMLWSDSNIRGDALASRVRGLAAGDPNPLRRAMLAAKRALKLRLVSPLVRGAAAVLPCGTRGAEYYARYGAAPDRTFLCPIEPDYSLIESPAPQALARVRDAFGLDPARRRLLGVARLVPLKCVQATIDAFAAIAGERPDWDLVIVGEGELRAALEARVPPHLRSRVVFTGFVGDPALVAGVARQCHVLVHPGYFEAWGVVLLEAAAAGLAIVCSDVVGAAADLVRDGENGRIVPPNDVPCLGAALREVTGDRLEPMRQASRRVSAEFRRRADPVAGLRAARARARVLRARERA